MNNGKHSTMQYSVVIPPVRRVIGLPYRVDRGGQTKASLDVWEGEGGAIESAAAVLRLPADVESKKNDRSQCSDRTSSGLE